MSETEIYKEYIQDSVVNRLESQMGKDAME